MVFESGQADSQHLGAVIEYQHFGSWVPALITDITPDGTTLTVAFTFDGVNVQQCVQRNSAQVAHFGLRYAGELPPGFHKEISRSRPGQYTFVDRSGFTCLRYGSLGLAWKAYLERMQQMEALPTVSDCHPASGSSFTWANAAEMQSGLASIGENHADAASDVIFSADVLTELMAAPSPDYVPTKVFEKNVRPAEHAMEKVGPNGFSFPNGLAGLVETVTKERENTLKESSSDQHRPSVLQRNVLPPPLEIATTDMQVSGKSKTVDPKASRTLQSDVLPEPLDVLTNEKLVKDKEHVAKLEGALEESRDRVKQLERLNKSLEESTAGPEIRFPRPWTSSIGNPLQELGHGQVPVHVEVVRTPKGTTTPRSTTTTVDIFDSLERSTTCSEGNVFTVESDLLEDANKISGLRRTVDALYVKSQDYERRLDNLQSNLVGRMSTSSQSNRSECGYAEPVEEKQDARAANGLQEGAQDSQCDMLRGRGFVFNPEGPICDSDLPSVICEVKVMPPKSSRARNHVPLPRARTPPRSPKVLPGADGKSDAASKLERSPSPLNSRRQVVPSYRGPPRRSISSVNSVSSNVNSQAGSPSAGYRTPRSLSPPRSFVVATPAKESRSGRGSSVSVSGSSVRSSVGASSSYLASVGPGSPDRYYKICPTTLTKKATYMAPHARSPTPTRSNTRKVVPQWCRVRTTSVTEGWEKVYQAVA